MIVYVNPKGFYLLGFFFDISYKILYFYKYKIHIVFKLSYEKVISYDKEIKDIILDCLERNLLDNEVSISVIADITNRRLNISKEFATERIMKVVIENLNGYIVKDGCITSI